MLMVPPKLPPPPKSYHPQQTILIMVWTPMRPKPLLVLMVLMLYPMRLLIPTWPCSRRLFPAFPVKTTPSTLRFPRPHLAVKDKSMEVRLAFLKLSVV